MNISRLVLFLFFAGLTTILSAQKIDKNRSNTGVEMAAANDPIMTITPDQMAAIQQLEEELRAKEERKKAGQINYQSDIVSLMKQREEKLKVILTPEQWIRYDEMSKEMAKANEERKTARINKVHRLETTPQVID